jgi:DegV family protein with EDD domain
VSSIRFVADSTADLQPDYVKAHNISLIPLRVIFGDEELRDYFDIQPEAFYERMRTDTVHPRTSQPSPAEFEAAFKTASDDGSTVICTTISSDLSGTWNSAMTARQALPERDIRIIDTRTATVAHNMILQRGVEHAESGADADSVVARIEEFKESNHLVFTVETLEYLKRGGRIGGAQAMLGTLLSIKPVLSFEDGKVEALDKVRTFSKALDRLLQELEKTTTEWGTAPDAMVGHAANPDAAKTLSERAAAITGKPVPVSLIGPVIGVHGGPGAIGLVWQKAASN